MKKEPPASPPLCRIRLEPAGETVAAAKGSPLREALAGAGVEFPCGGRGVCRGCRVNVLEGSLPVTEKDAAAFDAAELAAGRRLACAATVTGDLVLEPAQWGAVILAGERPFPFAPREGFGIAVDLGTTTVVAQLVNLETGRVLGVRSLLNPQAAFGGDVMSRVGCAAAQEGAARLTRAIRAAVGRLAADLAAGAGRTGKLHRIVLAGNTVMHHLFLGIDTAPLAAYPFETPHGEERTLTSSKLGWKLREEVSVTFLPCLGGFVGSDILAGIVSAGILESSALSLFMDLGTNGEIAAGNSERVLCASTAAGPAFEGGAISKGMRAAPGAIFTVKAAKEGFSCGVIGGGKARGICGSGLVSAVAAGLDLELIDPGGRLVRKEPLVLAPGVSLTQKDIRELQLAKGAVAAGARILLETIGARPGEVERFFLAGAFGNTIDPEGARRIGMIPCPAERVRPAGNAALTGAKMALFDDLGEDSPFTALRKAVTHVPLNTHPRFQEIFVEEMAFPPPGG